MFVNLPDCVLSKLVSKTSFGHLVMMAKTDKSLRERMNHVLADMSAKRIQDFWRWCRYVSSTRIVVNRFQQIKLSSAHLPAGKTFDQLITHLRSAPVLAAGDKFIKRIFRACVLSLRPRVDSTIIPPVNVRVFFALFMIKYYPADALDQNGERELNLRRAADALSLCMEAIVARVAATGSFSFVGVEMATEFPLLVARFGEAFRQWKGPDEALLVQNIVAALVAMMLAVMRVPDGSPEHAELTAAVVRMRDRLLQIAGPAAVAQLDRDVEAQAAAAQAADVDMGDGGAMDSDSDSSSD
jgi:hypothetical protein